MPLWCEDFKDSYARLARGSVPTLFVWGDSDCTVPFSEAEHEVRNLFSPVGVSCCMLPESGHGLLLEDASQVSSIATAWFHDVKDPAWIAFLARWRLAPNPDAPTMLGTI
ncbi:acoC [Symbiodinium pilosum]|uniref:AcoC protein n=1 Tax=Symbiodinium pilosum TaxID=2952 RepID=A0A812TBF1_SYMPI|nr:acoC [Symbiodinium pilosum]